MKRKAKPVGLSEKTLDSLLNRQWYTSNGQPIRSWTPAGGFEIGYVGVNPERESLPLVLRHKPKRKPSKKR